MKILITGGAGFIGSHLADALIEGGHNVVVVDNLILGREENIAHLFKHDRFRFYKQDLLKKDALRLIFKKEKFDVIFHLAANSDIQKGGESPEVDLELTFMTTFSVLQCMKEFDVKQIIFSSSSAMYGESTRLLHENHGPLFPVSFYGAGKLASEGFISAFCENFGIQAWILRFPNVVGERATHGAIFDFINKLTKNPTELEVLGDGEQNKPYLYVKDLVEGMVFAWENSFDKLNVFNLGVDSRTKVKKMAQIVIEEMGLDAVIRFTGGDRGWVGDIPEFRYDLTKIHKLGWQAKMTSDEAVRLAVRKILKKEIYAAGNYCRR
jgi:UDP-glucose 4-epimerase